MTDAFTPALRPLPSAPQPPPPTPLAALLTTDDFCAPFLRMLLGRLGDPTQAEDLLSKAIVRALKREAGPKRWSPANGPPHEHFRKVVRNVLRDRRRWLESYPGRPFEEQEEEQIRADTPSPEDEVAERLEANERRRLANELHRSLIENDKDPVAAGYLEALAQGVTDHPAIAARLGCTVDEVLTARKRLQRYAQAVVKTFREQARFQ